MKRREAIKTAVNSIVLATIGVGPLGLKGCGKKGITNCEIAQKFTFAFFTDVHLLKNNDRNSHIGFQRALDDAMTRNIDFILFGGDNIEAVNLSEFEADVLFNWFKHEVDKRGINAFYTIGNHDTYYRADDKKNDPSGYNLHKKHFGEITFSFDHKGIHFIVLNSVGWGSEGYIVGEEQCKWLIDDLEETGFETPIVVSLHVPIQSLHYPAVEGKIVQTDIITDFKNVWDILEQYNVKMVLQGHMHLHEELFVKDMQFVTGGAVSGNWWGVGDYYKTDKGYLLVNVDKDSNFTWEYISFVKEKDGKERWEYTQESTQYAEK